MLETNHKGQSAITAIIAACVALVIYGVWLNILAPIRNLLVAPTVGNFGSLGSIMLLSWDIVVLLLPAVIIVGLFLQLQAPRNYPY